jgi:menaquinone-specific isochorismate synthase
MMLVRSNSDTLYKHKIKQSTGNYCYLNIHQFNRPANGVLLLPHQQADTKTDMPDSQPLINRVCSYLGRLLSAEPIAQRQIVSISMPIREINLHSLPAIAGNWLFWNHPSNAETIFGLGHAMQITASGPGRLDVLNQELQQLHNNWKWLDPEHTKCKPLSHLCFAFNPSDQMSGPWDGLPNSGLFLPELTIQQQGNSCVAIFSTKLGINREPEAILQRWRELFTTFINSLTQQHTPPGCKTTLSRIATSANQDHWRQLIAKAQSSIFSATLEKVVPARHLRVKAERSLDPRRLMTTLEYLYPDSMLLANRTGERTFLSATPECLVSLQNGDIYCDALAGTIHRSANEQQDQDLGQTLLSDPKAKHEHQLVVQDITTSLGAICSDIKHSDKPSLLRMRNLQHLHTEIKGQLKSDITLLDAAARLHPTAAVNGYPEPEAKLWLRQNESIERGWYTGAAGWIDYSGNGKLAVLLRCALLDNNYADLFAGAGITAESDANSEYAETELKFRVMLEALENA